MQLGRKGNCGKIVYGGKIKGAVHFEFVKTLGCFKWDLFEVYLQGWQGFRFSPLIKTEAITIWVLVKATMATLTVCYPSVCDNSKVDQVNGRQLFIVSDAEHASDMCNEKIQLQ